MKLQEIIARNKQYQENKKKVELEYAELQTINSSIDLNELSALSYEEVKAIRQMTRYAINNKDVDEAITNIYNKKREEAHPVLKEARYFPVIKGADFLTDEEKVKLDNYLSYQGMSNYLFEFGHWRDLKFSKDKEKKIKAFLEENGVTKRLYDYKCECGEGGGQLTEEKFNYYLKHFRLKKEDIEAMTEEEYEKYIEEDSSFYIGCFDCEGREITTEEGLMNYRRISYKLKELADRSTDSL